MGPLPSSVGGIAVKNVSRRTFLGTAIGTGIGTGILGSAALTGLPILPKQIQALLPQSENKPNSNEQPANDVNQSPLVYESVPSFLNWSFGEQYRSSPNEAMSSEFKLWFSPIAERRNYDFREEVFAKCREIDQKRNGKTIALCHGGGESSEIIAHALKELGIPFDLFFIDNWMLNHFARKNFVEPLAKKLNVPLHVVSISESYFEQEFMPNDFSSFGSDHPNTMLMRYLFSVIPHGHFIVTGAGSLERSGPKIKKIAESSAMDEFTQKYGWTFSSSHVAYYDWAKKMNRPGEYYFFQSSPGLLLSVLESPMIDRSFPHVNIKGLIYSAFPQVTKRGKTTNWDLPNGQARLDFFRGFIKGIPEKRNMSFWKPLVGCNTNVAGLYRLSKES